MYFKMNILLFYRYFDNTIYNNSIYFLLQGHKNVGDLWRKSGLEWLDFVPEDQIEKFLKDKVINLNMS